MDPTIWRTTFLVVDILVGIAGILMNSFLLYLVTTQSPPVIHKYKIFLVNSTLNDLILSSMIIFLSPRIIGLNWTFVLTSEGICPLFDKNACFIGGFVLLGNLSHLLFSLLLSFFYRMYCIRNPPPSTITLLAIVFCVAVPSILQIVFGAMYIEVMPTRDELNNYITGLETKLLPNEVVYGVNDIRDWRILYCLAMMVLPVIPIYIVIVFIRKRTIFYLKSYAISAKGVRTQAELLQVLSYQALLPLLFAISVVMYIIGQSTNWSHITFECSILFSVSLIPIISPIITIYYVKPYKSYLHWHFGMSKFRKSAAVVVAVAY